ncbi:deoxyribose-phosphate aldolase [Blastococcus sp. CCUG 61487]|uniref:deoxyribose-phosphate aldolase n=1 Tax=Blastococcus sp. CCUG 61487 TaxID=1840703 RepID=UPI0010C0B074|nr:deoxyribose-phosphate aldolase [Blastococcus sp. CCUG 61487]TKJ21840.1 2-deoxyribose-5-phosphate aldolase [Blastococcus sp. CCUG 61487]
MRRSEFARLVDHTLLKSEALGADVDALVDDALAAGVAAVCVSSARVGRAAGRLTGSGVAACTVVGFPSGAVLPEAKVAEVHRAAEAGATEFDMVLDIGRLRDGDRDGVVRDIAAVRAAVPDGGLLKVILETAALDDDRIRLGCLLARDAGADFVKTSTGFHPSGGATVEAVRLMRETVPDLGVKASGGIRDLATALRMLDAGATRLGMSATVAVLAELPD